MEEIKEVWKSLEFLGYPNYEVSTFGRVKSLNYRRSGKERILKQGKHKNGYLIITLNKVNRKKTFTVHRLVCLAFLKNDNNYPYINHKNEIKTDNHVENLEWVSPKENTNYGTCKERISKSMKGKPKSEEYKRKMRKPILQYTKDNVFIREWDSATDIKKELNIHQSNICNCCNGKYKTSGGFIWRYKQ